MKKNNYGFIAFLRPLMMLFPLMLGSPFFSYCLCSFDCVMTVVGLGPFFGGIVTVYTAVLSALVCFLMGFDAAFCGAFALQIMLVSAVCAVCIIKRKPFYTGTLLCSIAYGIPFVLNLKAEADKAGLSIADSITKGFTPVNNMVSIVNGIDTEMIGNVAEMVAKRVKMSIPSMAVICAAMSGYIVMWLVSRALRGSVLDNKHSFSDISLGKDTLIFGGAILLMLFVPQETVSMVAFNGLIVFLFMSFCCGMSLTEYLLRKKVKSFFARVVIHGAILLLGMTVGLILPFLNTILIYVLLGIMDGFVSIRKRVDAGYEEK